ncbi:MAG: hypothetical protein WCB22_00430, partial [Pseudolabrys sp.]
CGRGSTIGGVTRTCPEDALLPVASQRAVSPAYNQSTFVDKPCAPWEHPDDAEPPSLGQADPGGPAARYRMLKQAAKGRT